MTRATGSRRKLEGDVARVVAQGPAPGYTVLVKNALLRSTRYVGSFATEQQATDYAAREAARSRTFASFEIWTGSAQQPGKFLRDAGAGRA